MALEREATFKIGLQMLSGNESDKVKELARAILERSPRHSYKTWRLPSQVAENLMITSCHILGVLELVYYDNAPLLHAQNR
jgi:hypothetical protein